MKIRNLLIATIVAFVGFSCGLLIGTYKIFPFKEIRAIKRIVIPKREIEQKLEIERFSDYYYHKTSFFESHFKNAAIVMLGDSITEYAEWDELFDIESIINRGIDGDTTEGVLHRIDSVACVQPRTVFLMIGINDIGRGKDVQEIYANYKMIVRSLMNKNIKIVLQSTLFTRGKDDELNRKVEDLNKKLIELSQEHNLEFVDLNSILAPNGFLEEKYSRDGLHLNGQGYSKWKMTIESLIKQNASAYD